MHAVSFKVQEMWSFLEVVLSRQQHLAFASMKAMKMPFLLYSQSDGRSDCWKVF
jgi:hypothetical protein